MLLQLLQFRENLLRTQPILELHIKKLPPDYPVFINKIGSGPCDLPIACINDVIGINRRFRLVGKQRIGYLECLPCHTRLLWGIRADSNKFGTFRLDGFVAGLQLTELRLAEASRAETIEYKHDIFAEIIGEGTGISIGIK